MESETPDQPPLPTSCAEIEYELDGHKLEIMGNGPDLRDMLVKMIDEAQQYLKLYYYLFADDESGRLVLARLVRAARRGVDVRLMVDSFGSIETPRRFFAPLEKAGGKIGWFGSSLSTRSLIRNHQKMTIADGHHAIVGGFNISDAYFGVPEDNCWADMGMRISGKEVATLERWNDMLWEWVISPRQRLRALRAMVRNWHDGRGTFRWLIGGPTNRLSPWARTVRADLEKAKQADIVEAYFSPGNGMLARIRRVARRGKARLILAAKSDNTTTIAAARLLYGPLLRAGTQIYEYQPCRLHMKLLAIDDAVYIGSANFDMRSLYLNVELMLRIEDREFAEKIRAFIDKRAEQSLHVTPEKHKSRRTPLRLLKGWLSYFLVGILDYKITRRLNFPE
ncbi:MAG: phosphatidylserine/phosphatidylglycerophosphate/cardiolipin synthase family protein [Sphingobium sp.]